MKMYSKCFLCALLGFFVLAVLVQAQDQSGFISIDCGIPADSSYNDETTDIKYIPDSTLVETGINKNISSEFQDNTLAIQFYSVRSFPEGMKNCYTLNPEQGKDSAYLIRASFMYGNYDSENKPPELDLYLGVNIWDSIKLDNSSSIVVKEIIHMPTSDDISICLVNKGLGTPFISVLELRLLSNSTYITQSRSIVLYRRMDLGSSTGKIVRYKNDVYDRIWEPLNFLNFKQLSTSLPIIARGSNDMQPPSVVMSTAITPTNASKPLNIIWNPKDPALKFYVYMHFAEVVDLPANQYREFNISINDEIVVEYFSPQYLFAISSSGTEPFTGGMNLTITRTEKSTLPPILNALEIYVVKDFIQAQTDQVDVDAIMNTKKMYGMKRNWQGDPCTPKAYSWDGLNCTYEGYDPPRIISLNLSSSGLTGEIAPYLSNLTLVQFLDLSNNSLSGKVPEFLSQLPFLKVLNLKGNKLTGSLPAGLLERSKNGSLALSVDENLDPCISSSCQNKKYHKFIIPLVASAATLFTLLIALAVWWSLKRRKNQASIDNENDSFELENRRFTYSEVVSMTDNFKTVLGKGGFGTVYHGYLDGTQVAVKMLSSSSGQGYKEFQAEVKLLMRVHHRNLTNLVGYCSEGTNMGLIYEFMASGNLQQRLSDRNAVILSWEDRLRIAMDAAQGLEYLHKGCKPPIVHRDIKSSNILLNENFEAKLADFGLSRIFPTGVTHVSTVVAGTPGYLDPEYYVTNWLNEKSDVYSFGVVLLEIITSRPVITKHEDESTHISQWVTEMLAKGDIENAVDPSLEGDFEINSAWKAVELAMTCASYTSSKRPTMNEVVMELKQCLTMELARKPNCHGNEPNNPREIMTINADTESNPIAR